VLIHGHSHPFPLISQIIMTNKLSVLLITAIFFLLAVPVHAKNLHKEAEYQSAWCIQPGSIIEYVLPGRTRVDCLLDEWAVEADFAKKWAEAIGQARFYAIKTGRSPGVLLIMEDMERDFKYLARLLVAIEGDNLKWRVWITTPDDLGID